jgi:NAD(P)-dependent dehydrogenase (short-subunit alcohol dehydrogenase family)
MKHLSLSGKVALVTGGASGIGRATALAFAEQGIAVVVADINVEGGEHTARSIRDAGGKAQFVRCDVTRDAEVKALVEHSVTTYGSLDYAFNNAGIELERERLADGSESDFDAIMNVNVKGVWLCLKHELPVMVAQGGGAIVNTASVAGLVASPRMSVYGASKHAVVGLTKTAAVEYAKKKVRVNAICPGIIDTEMYRRVHDADPKTVDDIVKAFHPVGRAGTVDEVAGAVLYLCSDSATFTTGQALAVDGGGVAR